MGAIEPWIALDMPAVPGTTAPNDVSNFLTQPRIQPRQPRNVEGGVRFELVNRLVDIELVTLRRLAIGREPIPLDQVQLQVAAAGDPASGQFDAAQPFPLPLNTAVRVTVVGRKLPGGKHEIDIGFEARTFGDLQFTVEDCISEDSHTDEAIPVVSETGPTVQDPPIMGLPRPQDLPSGSPDPPAVLAECEQKAELAEAPPGSAEPTPVHDDRESVVALYDNGMKLITSSVDIYIDKQKELLELAIQQFEDKNTVVARTTEAARSVMTDLATSLNEAAQKSAVNLVTAGKLFFDLARQPHNEPETPAGGERSAKRKRRRRSTPASSGSRDEDKSLTPSEGE